MTKTATSAARIDRAAMLSDETRPALRSLILTLADSKRLLGIRYSDWMLGAPTLETGIAASSMAQDEWGHGRLSYALLAEFGDEPKRLEHDRAAEEYHSMEELDSPFGSWSEMIAAALLLDGALATQYSALADSRYSPLHNRVQKLLDEEEFHYQYAAGWAPRLAANAVPRAEFSAAAGRFLKGALTWFGPADDSASARLLDEGLTSAGPEELRSRFLQQVGPVLHACGVSDEIGLEYHDGLWSHRGQLDWTGWDAERRRSGSGGPDADTISRVRGDKNRAMLLD
jgi:ring-1,2-phenylacetyl-CoA epoxidase subunit PaaC